MIAKVSQPTELGPLRALPTARHAQVDRGIRLSPAQYAQLRMDCRRRSSSCCHPKLVPLFNESGKLVPTSHRWGHQDGHVIRQCTKPGETSRGYVSSNWFGIKVTPEGDSGPQPLFFLNSARFQLDVGVGQRFSSGLAHQRIRSFQWVGWRELWLKARTVAVSSSPTNIKIE